MATQNDREDESKIMTDAADRDAATDHDVASVASADYYDADTDCEEYFSCTDVSTGLTDAIDFYATDLAVSTADSNAFGAEFATAPPPFIAPPIILPASTSIHSSMSQMRPPPFSFPPAIPSPHSIPPPPYFLTLPTPPTSRPPSIQPTTSEF